MTNLKISNEVRLIDFIIILLLSIFAFTFYYHSHEDEMMKEFGKLNVRLDNIEELLKEPVEFIIKD